MENYCYFSGKPGQVTECLSSKWVTTLLQNFNTDYPVYQQTDPESHGFICYISHVVYT